MTNYPTLIPKTSLQGTDIQYHYCPVNDSRAGGN